MGRIKNKITSVANRGETFISPHRSFYRESLFPGKRIQKNASFFSGKSRKTFDTGLYMGRINKAQFFSIDALVALSIIILVVVAIVPTITNSRRESSISADLIQVLNSLKIGELQGVDLVALNIQDLDKPIIEQIGEFYLTNKSIAISLSEKVLSGISPNENIGIWYGDQLLASRNITPFETAGSVTIERQVISGIGGMGGVTGMSTRAFISSSARTDYFYFGGYVGEGNISSVFNYNGNISSVNIELVISDDFEVLVNGINSGSFTGSINDNIPVLYNISTANFISGQNTIEFIGDNLHISGGYIRISYDSEVIYSQPKRYNFPGITGAINLYDAFHIPGNLTGLEISLHFDNPVRTFLSIGNTTVFNDTGLENTTISLTNATLASLLDYDDISRKTIPLRFGMENVSYVVNNSKDIDVFSVTDISGSMGWGTCTASSSSCCQDLWNWNDCESYQSDCISCGGVFSPRIIDAKAANDLFIDMILNDTTNRVGLAAYSYTSPDTTYHALSNDNVSLKAEVASWNANGGTCICCGVNKAIAGILADSSSSKFQSIVVMSDGEANYECVEQNTGDAGDDAVQSACDAYEDYGIRVYTIGFGSGAGVQTLTDMANCGGGSFFATVDDLESIYEKIAEELFATAYYEQTVEVIGNIFSKLFSDSFIEFEYEKDPAPTGLISTIEKKFSTTTTGTFDIPENYTVVDANVISYSGPWWTSVVDINGDEVYNLSEYNADYLELGDPYSIYIPTNLVQDSNTVTLKTGLSSDNTSAGSIENTIIYTISKELVSFNAVSAFADGCIWDVQFTNKNSTLTIPSSYSGNSTCSYKSGTISCSGNNCEDSTDSTHLSVYSLFKTLDFDSDGIIDVELSSQDLQIEISTLSGIPFYHSTEFQIRQWD